MDAATATIQIFINGEARTVPASLPLTDLISSLGLPPQTALVEHNGRALLRADWPERKLGEGDQLEILRVVAGG